MSRALFDSTLSAEQEAKLAAIESDVDELVSRKLRKFAIWASTPAGDVRLLVAADGSVLLEIPARDFAEISGDALLAKVDQSLGSGAAAVDAGPGEPPSSIHFTGIFLYVDGSDLDDVAASLEQDLAALLAESGIDARLVNEKSERTPDLGPEDLPDWNLGLNLDRSETARADLKRALDALGPLAAKHGREFVLGYYDADSGISEDIAFIGSASEAEAGFRDACSFLGI